MTSKIPECSIGIEEELFIVHKDTGKIVTQLPDQLHQQLEDTYPDEIAFEYLESQVEIVSKPCQNIQQLRQELIRLRRAIIDMCADYELVPYAASTHPVARWQEQHLNKNERYKRLTDELQVAAHRMLVCGTHFHIGIDDENERMRIFNHLLWYIPHLLALSTSSPFWTGMDTGLNCFRLCIIDNLPRSGLPEMFSSLDEYQNYVQDLTKLGMIENARELWWDARLSCRFPTIEMRVSDVCTHVDDSMALAALYLCLVQYFYQHNKSFPEQRNLHHLLINENRWQAQRYAVNDAAFIRQDGSSTVALNDLINELIDKMESVAADLGCTNELKHIRSIIKEGTSADRQRRVYLAAIDQGCNQAEAFDEVIKHVVKETCRLN